MTNQKNTCKCEILPFQDIFGQVLQEKSMRVREECLILTSLSFEAKDEVLTLDSRPNWGTPKK